jgi:hypothetical protein
MPEETISDPAATDPDPVPGHDEIKDAIAYICEHLDTVRSRLTRYGQPTALDDFVTAVANNRSAAEPVKKIHTLLKSRDGRGLYGATRGVDLLGVPAKDTLAPVYLCPSRLCSRLWTESGNGLAVPRCELRGQPLRRQELT